MSTETPCNFFFGLSGAKKGSCRNPSCSFSHDPASLPNINRIACEYHFGLSGKPQRSCKAGKSCPFSHDINDTHQSFASMMGPITAAGILLMRQGPRKAMEYYVVVEREQYADPGGSASLQDANPKATAARNFAAKTRAKIPQSLPGKSLTYYIPGIKYQSTVVEVAPDASVKGEGEWVTYARLSEAIHPRLDMIFDCLMQEDAGSADEGSADEYD